MGRSSGRVSLRECIDNKYSVWHLLSGYPYKTTEEYETALKDITDGLFEQENVLQPNDTLILMTHSGPNESG